MSDTFVLSVPRPVDAKVRMDLLDQLRLRVRESVQCGTMLSIAGIKSVGVAFDVDSSEAESVQSKSGPLTSGFGGARLVQLPPGETFFNTEHIWGAGG